MCHEPQLAAYFNYFVGAGEQRERKFDAYCLGGLLVDNQLE